MNVGTKDLRWCIAALLISSIVACSDDNGSPAAAAVDPNAPSIAGAPVNVVPANAVYKFEPSAIDPNGDRLVFGVDGKPPWAVLDKTNGELTGTPTINDVGTYRGIVVWVTDGKTEKSLPPFDLTVAGSGTSTNSAPIITGTPATAVTAGTVYTFAPATTDRNGDQLSFTIRNRPTWATFNATDGKVQGTPQLTDGGVNRDIVISVSDGRSTIAMAPFSIAVALPDGNAKPTISGTPMASVEAGTAYTFVPTAADADDDSLTFSITGHPAWATFDAQTGALGGAPAIGTFSNISIRASDGQANATLGPFSITVVARTTNAAPVITGGPVTWATQGVLYSFKPAASDTNGDTLTFTIANRPVWAAFDTTTGQLSGTPGAPHVRTYGNIVIGVTDGKTATQLSQFSIAVGAANKAPTIAGTPAGSVMQSTQYSFQPTADDGDGDVLTYTIANKPAWATFSVSTGRLQGTPDATHIGTTSGIVIRATDGEATAALPTFSIAVQGTAMGSATLSWVPPTVNADGTPLTDLAGFKVYWGTTSGTYPSSATISNPGITSYMVENLVPGTYYFVTTAYTASGAESGFSNPASKAIK